MNGTVEREEVLATGPNVKLVLYTIPRDGQKKYFLQEVYPSSEVFPIWSGTSRLQALMRAAIETENRRDWYTRAPLVDACVIRLEHQRQIREANREHQQLTEEARRRKIREQYERDVAATKNLRWRTVTLDIPLRDGSTMMVKGRSYGGLVVHQTPYCDPRHKTFTVAHERSGRAVVKDLPSQEHAKVAIVRLLPFLNWTLPADELERALIEAKQDIRLVAKSVTEE